MYQVLQAQIGSIWQNMSKLGLTCNSHLLRDEDDPRYTYKVEVTTQLLKAPLVSYNVPKSDEGGRVQYSNREALH